MNNVNELKCKSCFAGLHNVKESGVVSCEYCGTENEVVLESAKKPQSLSVSKGGVFVGGSVGGSIIIGNDNTQVTTGKHKRGRIIRGNGNVVID